MSKSDGKYIGIQFTQPLIGDVTGLTPTPVGGYGYSEINVSEASVTTLNYYSSSYTGEKTIDGSLSSWWRGTTAINWLIYHFSEAFALTKLRLYMGSYYIKTFTISGSNDGTTWTQIGDVLTGASSSTSQWYEYELSNSELYSYYKISTLTTYSSIVYLYEIEMFETLPIGNEAFFSVTGEEYDFVPNGNLESKTYIVKNVTAHPTISNSILIEIEDLNRFCSVVGNLTVTYAGGNLTGEGGPVTGFQEEFTPEDLISKPNQNDQEHVDLVLSGTGILLHIYYTNTQNGGENVNVVSISGSGVLTHIDDI